MGKKAVIVGATGLVGKELLGLLLDNDDYDRVIVLVRNRLNMVHAKLEQHIISFDQLESIPPDWIEKSVVFCTLGTTMKKAKTKEGFMLVDYDYPMTIGRLALRYHAEQLLIVTAMGADANSRFFYNRVKGKVEDDLKKLGLPSLSIFRPSLLTGDRHEHRAGEQAATVIARKLPFLFTGVLRKYKPISAYTVAKSMMGTADGSTEKIKVIHSDEMAE